MKKLFGNKNYSILAFHNQWLYGRTALVPPLNILTHSSQFTREQKIDNNGGYNSPFTKAGQESHFGMRSDSIDSFIQKINFILDYIPVNITSRDAGFLGSFLINEEDGMLEYVDFTGGDNNDGITIIDTIENKYCFMNIYEQSVGELDFSSGDLPELVPVSAHDYVKAYYGETPETVNPYHYRKQWDSPEPLTLAEQKKLLSIVKGNIKDNALFVKKLAKFQVLTTAEVKKMFPKNEVKKLAQ